MTAILSFPRPSLIETMADREADRLVEAVGMPRTPEELRLFARDIAIMTTAVPPFEGAPLSWHHQGAA